MAPKVLQESSGAPLTFTVGSKVWVEDEREAWVEGTVESRERRAVKVLINGQVVTVKPSSCLPMDSDAPDGGVDDMTKLAYLHEPGVLNNLALRYQLDEIYTYTGKILIAVNPFQKIPHLYGAHMMEQYRGMRLGELSPHVFAIAESAYREMTMNDRSQSILVSGESGAGKTETTKLLMQYLAYIGGRASADRSVEAQVLESNPLLEAFGNAKTLRNDNSSRFGKFVQIQFDHRGRISGAAIRTYLLERSRVVQIADPERNYHCFYQLCAGATPEEAERWHLGPPESFHYLNQSSCVELDGKESNAEQYEATRRAMDIVGLSPGEQDAIFRVVAAILHLGNITFAPGLEGDTSRLADDQSKWHLEVAAELLRVDAPILKQSMLTRSIMTPEGKILKNLQPSDAVTSRDTLAKTLYARLFDWLVEKVNKSIGQDANCRSMIGVLDIYGFESFEVNSFEQFCINLANEKLQQHFNQHVFKSEQEEYEEEEIEWSYIDFVDNQDVLELIEKKPMGIIALLDEQCMFPRATPETFSTKLYQTLSSHRRFEKPKLSQRAFTIDHYAGKVTYDAELFLEKNKDYVIAEHQDLLSMSEDAFVADLFPLAATSAKSKFTSLGSGFKQQLEKLMATLNTMDPHYIRCVKPNDAHRPGLFQHRSVIQQLRCGGVLEAIRISCAGFPSRRPVEDFVDRFTILAPEAVKDTQNEVAAVYSLLNAVGIDEGDFQIGKSKVFLRAGVMAMLDTMRLEILNTAAAVIQRKMRTIFARRDFLALRAATIKVQTRWRGVLARNQYARLQAEAAAALKIQAAYRGHRTRKALWRSRTDAHATVIQAAWRRHKCRTAYLSQRKGVVAIQGRWKVRSAKKELRHLRIEARSNGKLQEAKSQLEKQNEQLHWQCSLERKRRVEAESKAEAMKRRNSDMFEELQLLKQGSPMATPPAVRSSWGWSRGSGGDKADKSPSPGGADKARALSQENSQLRAAAEESGRKVMDTEQRLRLREQELQQARDDVAAMQEQYRRLEEHVRNLEMENQLLRQQSLSATITPRGSARIHGNTFAMSMSQRGLMGDITNNSLPSPVTPDSRHPGYTPGTPPSKAQTDPPSSSPDGRRRRQILDRQQQDQEALLQCMAEPLGFDNGRPVLACILYKSLVHWRSLEAERTNIFDRIVQTIGGLIEKDRSLPSLAYWLSNAVHLLALLQSSVKAGAGSQAPTTPLQRRRLSGTPGFGRMVQSLRGSGQVAPVGSPGEGAEGDKGLEAKYPALMFKQQLTAYVEKLYSMIRDSVKKSISPTLASCIQAPRTRANQGRAMPDVRSGRGAAGAGALSLQWSLVLESLSELLSVLGAAHVPPFLVRKLFTQIFSFINVQLFNSLLLRRECCSFSNGEYVKAGLQELEQWIEKAPPEHVGSAMEELKYIRQAVDFLVVPQKPRKALGEITGSLCPSLSMQQLYRISTMYWDDKYGTHSVNGEVVAQMRQQMTEDSGSVAIGNSFLLDDDSSIPFALEDVSRAMPPVTAANTPVPSSLRDNSAFIFLQGRD